MMNLRPVPGRDFVWTRNHVTGGTEMDTVRDVVDAVRMDGDSALRRFTADFDRCEAALQADFTLRVPMDVMEAAWRAQSPEWQEALQAAAHRILTFHRAVLPTPAEVTGPSGERMGMAWRPLKRVGVYAPGGRGAYSSTVLMDVIPAQVAGVKEIVLVSPPEQGGELPHPDVLAAAHLLGVREMYRIGGAQAVAALAYGSESVPLVDKIVGPGNLYVALAKRMVMGDVGIDSIAGPSEIFVVADESVPAAWIAADLIAQAEHDVEAGAVCISTSWKLLDDVASELERQLNTLPRREVAVAALARWGALVHVETLQEAMTVVNASAPEHVELMLEDPEAWLDEVVHAGAVFLGGHTPEPVGDYYAGTNHVLPTHGSARYASGLSVHEFLRHMTYVSYNKETLQQHASHIACLARSESLEGHARSVLIRGIAREPST